MNTNLYFYSFSEKILNTKIFSQYYFYGFKNSKNVYIGNLSCNINENQIYQFFNNIIKLKRIIIGLHRITKNPCGFCFLEVYKFKDAKFAFDLVSASKIDKRILKIDFDKGYNKGRQFGRGKKGGQMKEESLLDEIKEKNLKCSCNYYIINKN
nr:nuclear cap-binding protein subunit 2 [Cryptomonas curvata]